MRQRSYYSAMKKIVTLIIAALVFELSLFAQLKKGDVSIKFYIQNDYYCAIVNRRNWDSPKTVILCAQKDLSIYELDNSIYEERTARIIYNAILGKIQPYLKNGDNVYFEPCGRIFFINLAALMTPDGSRCCDLYHFFRLSDIRSFPDDPVKKKDFHPIFLLFGGMDYDADPEAMNQHGWFCHTSDRQHLFNDIPGYTPGDLCFGYTSDGTRAGVSNLRESKGEIKFIFHLSYPFMKPYTGSEALEEVFRMEVRRNHDYIVHVSTHAFTISSEIGSLRASSDVYKRCGFLFSGAGHTLNGKKLPFKLNDGILYGEEIAQLDMTNCSLIVLGACNTALGVVTDYGIIGIQSALKRAGAHTILMTLWSVNDRATSEFMKYFYTHLIDGKSKHQSLELARKALRNSKDFNDPLYWAPFIMLD